MYSHQCGSLHFIFFSFLVGRLAGRSALYRLYPILFSFFASCTVNWMLVHVHGTQKLFYQTKNETTMLAKEYLVVCVGEYCVFVWCDAIIVDHRLLVVVKLQNIAEQKKTTKRWRWSGIFHPPPFTDTNTNTRFVSVKSLRAINE